MAKYEYAIEFTTDGENWEPIPTLTRMSLGYAQGYMGSYRDMPGPRTARRLVRSDGKVMEEVPAKKAADIGMVAGFPTANQYVAAALEATNKAIAVANQKRDVAKRVDLQLAANVLRRWL